MYLREASISNNFTYLFILKKTYLGILKKIEETYLGILEILRKLTFNADARRQRVKTDYYRIIRDGRFA